MNYKAVSTTEFRNNLSDLMTDVYKGQTLLVKKRGQLRMVMINLDSYEDLLAASDPANLKVICEARQQYSSGDMISFNEVFVVL